MLAKNVSLAALFDAAAESGVRLYHVRFTKRKDAFRFSLRPLDGRWQRISASRRRIPAVCYHGHRAFLEALYERHPDAHVESALARFESADDFRKRADDVARVRIGPGLLYGQACIHRGGK